MKNENKNQERKVLSLIEVDTFEVFDLNSIDEMYGEGNGNCGCSINFCMEP